MSGIYIKGMEMPKANDEMIEIAIFGDGSVIQTGESWRSPEDGKCYYRPTTPEKFFHADELPPHGRLIDADALMKTCGMATDCYDCPNGEHGWCKRSQDAANICEAIEDAPTIIEAEESEA